MHGGRFAWRASSDQELWRDSHAVARWPGMSFTPETGIYGLTEGLSSDRSATTRFFCCTNLPQSMAHAVERSLDTITGHSFLNSKFHARPPPSAPPSNTLTAAGRQWSLKAKKARNVAILRIPDPAVLATATPPPQQESRNRHRHHLLSWDGGKVNNHDRNVVRAS